MADLPVSPTASRAVACRGLMILLCGLLALAGGCAADTVQSGQADVQALTGSDAAAQLLAARRIGDAHWVPPAAVQPLVKLLSSNDVKLRRAAADALACLDAAAGREITPAILAAQKTERDNGVRAVLEKSIERFNAP